MAVFTPVYRPGQGQQTLLARQQKQERKRKREQDGLEDSDEDGPPPLKQSSDTEDTQRATSSYHPVRKTDPYHVAGHSREAPLPSAPFPHAPVYSSAEPHKSVEEEHAALHPPVYGTKDSPEDVSTSSRRRHLDNLTTILHTCMLRGDWQRASRAWGLLLRTEVAGRGMDVRQHGRWGVGAELLLRRGEKLAKNQHQSHARDGVGHIGLSSGATEREDLAFSDEGFSLAREYYERLILQYPHTPRNQHAVNALAFYPALFNVWIYEVQDRSKGAKKPVATERPASASGSERSADLSAASSTRNSMTIAKKQELEEAVPIAQRLDELLLSPPYDTSLPLLQLRGMIGFWLSDLYATQTSPSLSDDEGGNREGTDSAGIRQSRQRAHAEKRRALTLFKKVKSSGGDIPRSMSAMLDNEREESSSP